jgi:hypothetical protein
MAVSGTTRTSQRAVCKSEHLDPNDTHEECEASSRRMLFILRRLPSLVMPFKLGPRSNAYGKGTYKTSSRRGHYWVVIQPGIRSDACAAFSRAAFSGAAFSTEFRKCGDPRGLRTQMRSMRQRQKSRLRSQLLHGIPSPKAGSCPAASRLPRRRIVGR